MVINLNVILSELRMELVDVETQVNIRHPYVLYAPPKLGLMSNPTGNERYSQPLHSLL